MIKNIISAIKSFVSIISFCIKLTYNASKKYFILHLLINLISVILPILNIYISSMIIDILAENYSKDLELGEKVIGTFIILIIAFSITECLLKSFEALKNYIEGIYTDIIEASAKQQIMEKAGSLQMSHFDSSKFFDIINDVNSNSILIIMISFQVFSFLRFFIQFIITFVNIALWNWLLPLIIIISVIPSVIVSNKQLSALYQFQITNAKYDRKLTYLSNIAVNRSCTQDVRIFRLVPFLKKRFFDTWNDMFDKKKKIVKKYTKWLLLLDAIPLILVGIFLIILAMSVFSGRLTVGDYNMYQGLLNQATTCMLMVIVSYSQIYDGKIRISNYIAFMNIKPEKKLGGNKIFDSDEFEIEFRNVVFRYEKEQENILNGVSFKINSHEKIALVGTNGSGKTSIIKLLLRLYDTSEGEILINGINVNEYDIDSIRRCFSPMFQNYFNYAFSVEENIALSDLRYENDTEKICDAAKKSGALKFINEFEDKMQTYLTREYEDGEELSGGQWQKIALARTFFRNAKMYILDEPSSALDAESEDELFRHFDELYKNKGAILVSHRLSNVKNCDKIIVIDNGKIIEEGTHNELMEKNGKYAYMFNLQLEKYI